MRLSYKKILHHLNNGQPPGICVLMLINATLLSFNQYKSYYYQLSSHILQQVDTNPYLGVTFSEDLKWSSHITKITKKANSTLGFIRRNLKHCPESSRKTAYLALVRSTLEYRYPPKISVYPSLSIYPYRSISIHPSYPPYPYPYTHPYP